MESEIKRTRKTWNDLEKTVLERCGCRTMPSGGQKVKTHTKHSLQVPIHLLTREGQCTIFRLRTGHNRLHGLYTNYYYSSLLRSPKDIFPLMMVMIMQQSTQVLPVRAGRVPWAVHAFSTISVLCLHFGVLRCTVVWNRNMVQYIRLQQAFLSGGS
jgi:hypothetical protein